MSWRTELLGTLITESRILCENPHPNRRIRVKLNVAGVEKRPVENEIEGATKQFVRKAGQFIFGKQNFHKGAFGIIPNELDGFETSADIPSFDVSDDCYAEWIYYYFKIGNRFKELEKIARGVGSKRIHPEQIAAIEIPLPSKEVQEELLRRFNRIESQNGQIAAELNHQLALVKELRQAYLREAMQGKLVPQDPTDEPAEILLEKIKAEKEKLIAEKRIKRDKPLPPINAEETPFEIPSNWTWCRLGEIISTIFDGPFGSHLKTADYTESGVQVIRLENIGFTKFNSEKLTFISEEKYKTISQHTVYENDILVSSFIADGVKTTLIPKLNYIAIAKADCFTVRTPKDWVAKKFIVFALGSQPIFDEFLQFSHGMTRLRINTTQLRKVMFPLPPLAEQERIVGKLEKLMKFCDELEANIKEGITNANRLLQTALKEALEPKDNRRAAQLD